MDPAFLNEVHPGFLVIKELIKSSLSRVACMSSYYESFCDALC